MADNKLKPNYSSSSAEEDEEEVSGSEDEESSGSEDEESSGSEVSDSDSDKKQPIIQSSSQVDVKPDVSSESEEESGSDSDSDSPPKKPPISDPKIKPISSKPMEVEQVLKTKSKTSQPAKRPAKVTSPASEKDSKKPKTNTDDDTKKQLFQRLWSEDDEIVILQGMIDYKIAKNGESPSGDMGAFHEFIKKSLHVDVSRAQLVDKVRRLKKKFVNNVGREKPGKDLMFSKSHEQKGYELSKLIWGSDSFKTGSDSKKNGNAATSGAAAAVKPNGLDDKDVTMMDVEKSMDISRFVQYGRNYDGPVLTEEIMKGGYESLEGSKRVEIEEKWKDLKKQELELFVKRMDLLKEQAVRVLEAVNSIR